ncbi:hypothetical protein NDU88_008528 [Pleurodeles waltl]|uniref:Uncharacterized protein n=1 Tax=Pleurodeles waltl TaxID=8319 RepID=A0AAV7PSD5_PLEWA|nr:hypothetical protein NDU88_008528 [Pleurodeles waltl]
MLHRRAQRDATPSLQVEQPSLSELLGLSTPCCVLRPVTPGSRETRCASLDHLLRGGAVESLPVRAHRGPLLQSAALSPTVKTCLLSRGHRNPPPDPRRARYCRQDV